MIAENLIVSAECVQTGKRLIGYVCCCKSCRTRTYRAIRHFISYNKED